MAGKKLFVIHFSDDELVESSEYKELLDTTLNSENIFNIFMSNATSIHAIEKHYNFTQALNSTFPGFIKPDLSLISNLTVKSFYKGSFFKQNLPSYNMDIPIEKIGEMNVNTSAIKDSNQESSGLLISDKSLQSEICTFNKRNNDKNDCFGIKSNSSLIYKIYIYKIIYLYTFLDIFTVFT